MVAISYILGLILITGLSLVSLVFFLIRMSPEELKGFEFAIFYLSIFLSLSGIFALLGTVARRVRSQFRINWKMIAPALRQAVVMAAIGTVMLHLSSKSLLSWGTVMMLIAIGLLIEGLVAFREKYYAKGTQKN